MDKKELQDTYRRLQKTQKEIEKISPTYLRQSDFNDGTYLITEPGHYVLAEDIIFSPNPGNDYLPKDDSKYSTLGFSLGFFAAISISAENVYLDLNNHTISASKEFVLQQRFFSIIELADSPFIPGQGPGNFSNGINSARNTIIVNGTLGLSSHHGIHGNLNDSILIQKLKIESFEFVGIALNGSSNIVLSKLEIGPNLQESPVLATYSAGRFAKMFAEHLLISNSLSQEQKENLQTKLNHLKEEMDITFQEAISNQRISSDLFRNDSRLPDGNLYGIMIKDKGVAVNDFVDKSEKKTENVYLRKIKLKSLKARVDEIVGLSGKNKKGVQNDVAGAVFQIDKLTDSSGRYKKTVLSELQLYLAELSLSLGQPIGKNNITSDVIHWAKSGEPVSNLLRKGYIYKCGADSMFHKNKGITNFRLDACNNLFLEKCSFKESRNYGCMGITNEIFPCGKHDFSKSDKYIGADCYGIHLSHCFNAELKNIQGRKLFSENGDCFGIKLIFGCENIKLNKIHLDDLKAGLLVKGKWVGKNYFNEFTKYNDEKKPKVIGVKCEKDSSIKLKCIKIDDLYSCDTSLEIKIE